MLRRRTFLGAGALAIASGGGFAAGAMRSGRSVLQSFDREIQRFMELRGVPGGALAVVKDRRLVYAKGYGWADREQKIRATEDSLFRIASLSKPITAVAVMQLVEESKLSLQSTVVELLGRGLLDVEGGDPRWRRVTVEELLRHTGGWDRKVSYDPMFQCRRIAKAVKVGSPPGPRDVIRFMAGEPLDFDPGMRYAYSNFGYCLLGRVLEQVTGVSYEAAVRERVLERIGVRRMAIGASLLEGRLPGEVRYYMPDSADAPSVFGGGTEEGATRVEVPYGGFYLEAMDAHGGWVASVVDLARFAAALDDVKQSLLLRPKSLGLMYAPPAPPVSRRADGTLEESYYGCGWSVRPRGGRGANYWHTGSLPGTASLLVRRWDGLSWVALFNQRSRRRDLPDSAIDAALHRAAAAVEEWPEVDLFAGRE